jgi:hypothetical protein
MNIKNEIIVYVGNVMIQKRLGAFSTTCAECSKQLVENAPNLIIVIGGKKLVHSHDDDQQVSLISLKRLWKFSPS